MCFSVLQVVRAPGMNRLYGVWRDGRRLNEYVKTSYLLSLVPRIVGNVASKWIPVIDFDAEQSWGNVTVASFRFALFLSFSFSFSFFFGGTTNDSIDLWTDGFY